MAGAAGWDARFRAGGPAGSKPDSFLISAQEFLRGLEPGAAALDLACGAGRHAVWLAAQGFRVTAVDFSAEALARTARLAARRGVALDCRQVDLESPAVELGRESYGLVCGFFFLHRPLFPALRDALRGGGFIIYKTYTADRLGSTGRPRRREHLLEPGELRRLLDGFRVLRWQEQRGTAAVVAQKPGR